VESAVGQGSVFHFTAVLPLAPEQPTVPSRPPLQVRDGADPVAPPGRERGVRVLVVEDNPVNQRVVTAILGAAGHEVAIAANGRHALAALDGREVDLVLMDVQMPEMDGLQATAAIRARERTTGRHLPIVALTAHAMKSDRDACLAAGMDEYLSKPVNGRELLATIARLTGSPAAPRPATGPRPLEVDRDALLARLGGDRALLVEIVDLFKAEGPRLLSEIRRCLDARDPAGMQRAAHTLKGTVANFGASSAQEAAAALERLGRDGRLEGAETALGALESALDRLDCGLTRLAAGQEAS
jgi:two-component system, sensor histidine kinase and response regulator